MIVLDTNVISEVWKSEPNPMVLRWVDQHVSEALYLSAITVAELRYGIAAMPEGKRQTLYHDRLNQQVIPMFSGRILPFDLNASQYYASIMAQAKSHGRAIGKEDGYIAAVAAAQGFAVATRDTAPFLAAGLRVINPWVEV